MAPLGRDASVASRLLRDAGIASRVCSDLDELQAALQDDTSFVVVTEEALDSVDLRGIAARLRAQPPWSDLPFIILTQRGSAPDRAPAASQLSELLGNVSFLERPFRVTTFLSVARTAFKGRQRQYEARARIEELREGEQQLRIALLAGRLGSWTLDLMTSSVTASAPCLTLFGRAGDEPLSLADLIAAVHPDDRQRVEEALRVSVDTGVDYAIEHRNVWPDGSMHWAEMRARLVRDLRGQNPRLVGVSSDITDRKTAEETLRHLNETLEERVGERTAQLEAAHAAVLAEIAQRKQVEEQLLHAQKMETIGQLTGGIAHDFNNLLTAVLGNLELLRKHVPDDPRTARLIGGALQGVQRGSALTQRLLAFARRQDLKLAPTSLVELIRGMADLIERSVGSQIEVRLDLAARLPPAIVDANQIELAVLNLVINARDAMPEGGVLTIAVDEGEPQAGEELSPGRYVRLSVSDTGHGMDAETLRKATEPFFSTKGVGKGTGLGLSMIHGLAIQLNGTLRLTSAVGEGTRAELWLPATALSVPERNTEPLRPVGQPTRRATILVVDDDALIAMSTVDMLEDLGHKAIEVHSAERALGILQDDQPIDLLVTDYSMPRMNGAQLARAARELRPELPILLATGYAELPSGSDGDLPRIAKPYHQDQLAAAIDAQLTSASRSEPGRCGGSLPIG
jgi:PAS domain S-box-containing protein